MFVAPAYNSSAWFVQQTEGNRPNAKKTDDRDGRVVIEWLIEKRDWLEIVKKKSTKNTKPGGEALNGMFLSSEPLFFDVAKILHQLLLRTYHQLHV